MAEVPIRVTQILAGHAVGGAEAFFTRLVSALQTEQTDTSIEQLAILRPHQRWLEPLTAAQVNHETLRFGGIVDLYTPWRLKRLVNDFQPHVVLAWMSRAARMAPRAKGRSNPWTLAARLGGYYNLKYYRHCEAFIGNTMGICDYLVGQGVDRGRVWHIPNFVDERPVEAADLSAHGISSNRQIILAAGRLHANKGFDVLIDAVTKVPDATLIIAGSGPEEAALRARVSRLGLVDRVFLPGWVDDLAPWLKAADVFVCASRVEPLGNVVIEAWQRHCAVVSTRAEGPREYMSDGENGLMCGIDDADEMAAQIRRVLDEPALREDLAQAGYQRYLAEFSQARVLTRYTEFFEGVKP